MNLTDAMRARIAQWRADDLPLTDHQVEQASRIIARHLKTTAPAQRRAA